MLRPTGYVGRRIEARKRPKIVDEVRLIEVTAIQRDIGPLDVLANAHAAQRLLKSPDAAKNFGRESGFVAKYLDESPGAQADLPAHRRHAGHMRRRHEAAQSEPHRAVPIESPLEFG